MTDTINNVPFELLETLIEQHITAHGFTNHTARQAQLILCAPSPAGVDGLVAVKVWEADADWDDHELVVRLSDAQAIIDGLRGEAARLRVEAALAAERDVRHQQAKRIGELEGLLLRVQVSLSLDDTEWGYSGAEKYKLLADIRAALSSGKKGE